MKKHILIALLLLSSKIYCQKVIDGVEAIIGNEIILTSDIEAQYQQYLTQGYTNGGEIKCRIIEDLLYQKLLLNQAKIDSLEISEQEIESELEKRIRYFVGQVGSKEKLEEFYGRSIIEIKSEFRDLINDQLLSQRMQVGITAGVKVTPSEVKTYFNNLAKDSLPTVEAEVEISQIVLKPEISVEEKERIKNKLETFKERIIKGEDFKVLATLYSDDPGSAKNGGELGFVGRGDLVPAFEAAAYKLKGDELSDIIKSEFGYHIIQLIERRGEQINVRHILLKPKVSSTQLMELKSEIEDIAKQISDGKITFEKAALNFSDDESKNNEGLLINPNSGSSMFIMKDLDPTLYFVIEIMSDNEISAPIIMQTDDGRKAYRLIKLRKKTIAHTANLIEDYDKIRNVTLSEKKQETINDWLEEKIAKTYIKLGNSLKDCTFDHKWIIL
ncbi:MAG: peptidylprolyl isomerase [Flavobacteriales bacterium]|jgi:peptidyl-prolyl cis-trans isomerase SurA|nr:peptidylprolyl isomerase [Flavobacteriales bacterium]|tara:strand:+ start:23384 stop:24712 length:1329 start_codon:yes stop_codon:yes gene_type:complete